MSRLLFIAFISILVFPPPFLSAQQRSKIPVTGKVADVKGESLYDDENGILSGIIKKDTYSRYSLHSKVSYKIANLFILSNNAVRQKMIQFLKLLPMER
jgi:hypothetical protein